jgi:hypothetical protein
MKKTNKKEPFQIYYTPGVTLQEVVDQLNAFLREHTDE